MKYLNPLRMKRLWAAMLLFIFDAGFFMFTNPSRVASYILIVGFLLFALTLYYSVGTLLYISSFYGLSFGKHRHRLALFLSTAIGGLLALQSMGELTARDALVLLPIAVLLYVYLSYGKASLKT
jgi:hypothetical protein